MESLSRKGLSLRGAVALHGFLHGVHRWNHCRRFGHNWNKIEAYDPYAMHVIDDESFVAKTHLKMGCDVCGAMTLIKVVVSQSGEQTTVFAPEHNSFINLV